MKKILLLSAIFSLLFVSCNDDEDVAVFGPNQTIVGFTASYSKSFTTNLNTATLNVPVNLISYANETYPADVTMVYSIDATSTAVAGVDYDMPSVMNVTIPSGSTVAFIPFTVHPNVFDPEDPKTLVLNMTSVSTGNAIIGSQYSQVEVTLQGVCISDIAGDYSTSTFRPSNGVTYTFALETFTLIEGSTYGSTYVGQYYGAGQTPGSTGTALLAGTTNAGYTFTDICGKMQLATQNLGSAYSNEVRQSATQFANSTTDPDTGVITVYYSIFFTNNTVEREFISTYTPL